MTAVNAASPALRLWGTPELAGEPPLRFAAERRFQLLALLALASGQWVERDRAAALLWPEAEMATARRNLRKVLFMAHALVGEGEKGAIEAGAEALRWLVDSDVAALERAGPADADTLLAQRRGPPLQGLDDPRNASWSAWLAAERARLDRLWSTTAHARLAAAIDPADRAARAEALLAVDALDEAAVAALIDAEAVRGHVAAARQAYRRYAAALAQELGIEPAQALRDQIAALGAGTSPAAPASGEARGFIGRHAEMQALQALLDDPAGRLITLVGAGGVGKSRLAREWLARQSAAAGRTLWIELQDLDSLPGVVARWAAAMGLDPGDDESPADRLARLAEAAPAGPWRVVLDNAEHLDALAGLLDATLAAWPGLRLLVTSRVRLQADAEWVMALGGLAVPDGAVEDLGAAAGFDAVRLFEQAARRVQPGFDLSREWPAARALIQLLDGLPLALELAAGWVRLMPLPAVLQELANAPMALERSAHPDAPARPEHERLRDVAERTLALLAPAERRAAEAASVFGGGFTRAAAQAVTQAGLSVLSSLCEKSLLRFDGQRFRFHPWIQALLAERLARDADRRDELLGRHACHFAALARELAPHLHGQPRPLIDGVQAEDANLRIAWQHAVAQGLHAELRDLALPLATAYELQGRLAEATGLLRPALRLPPTDGTARAAQQAVRRALSALLLRQGAMADAATVAAGGVALGEASADGIVCRLVQGAVHWDQGDPAAAHEHFERALALARAADDHVGLGLALGQLGLSYGDLGQPEQAMLCLQEALAIHRELGHVTQTFVQLVGIGGQHVIQRELPLARPWLDEALELARQHGLVREQVQVADTLCFVLVQAGQSAAARELATAALPLAVQTGITVSRVGLVQSLARIEMAEGRFAEGHRWLAEAVALSRRHQLHAAVMRAVRTGAELLAAAGRHRDAARLFIGLQHCPLATPWDLESFERLLSRLPPDEVAAARRHAVDGTLDALETGWRRAVAEAHAAA